jgi:putative ABC transport system permease protein
MTLLEQEGRGSPPPATPPDAGRSPGPVAWKESEINRLPDLQPQPPQVVAADPRRGRVRASPAFILPVRLAWRQLRAGRTRLASAIAGVMFACVLVFMQLGFRSALFDSATNLPQAMRGELFLVHPLTQALFRTEAMPRSRAYQALAVPDVVSAVPIYFGQANWRNADNGRRRAVQLIGFDAEAGAVAFPGLAGLVDALKQPDTVAFDRRSRPEFGDVAGRLAREGPFEAELGSRRVTVVGTVELGPSFAADGNVVLSETNFRRVMTRRVASNADLIALRLRPGADVDAVKRQLAAALPGDVLVVTQAELVAWERRYWENGTAIGFIFAFGSIMGLIVGMVIVYQILFTDIATHLREYATLKAMGFSQGYLRRVVMGAALILALLGFLPGTLLSVGLYRLLAGATFLPLYMDPSRAAMVFLLIFGMCASAGLLAMRKLREADPADMF